MRRPIITAAIPALSLLLATLSAHTEAHPLLRNIEGEIGIRLKEPNAYATLSDLEPGDCQTLVHVFRDER